MKRMVDMEERVSIRSERLLVRIGGTLGFAG